MLKCLKQGEPPQPEKMAEMVSKREDVSAYFASKFTVVRPVPSVKAELTKQRCRSHG
jgi:hypothetical protein